MDIPPLSPPTSLPTVAPVTPVGAPLATSTPQSVTTVDISPMGEVLSANATNLAVTPNIIDQPAPLTKASATNELQHAMEDEALRAAISETQSSTRALAAGNTVTNSTAVATLPATSPAAPVVAPLTAQAVIDQVPTHQSVTPTTTTSTPATALTPVVETNPLVLQARLNTVDVHFAAIDPSVAEALAAYHLNDGTFGVSPAQAELAMGADPILVTAVDTASEITLELHEGEHPAQEATDPDGHPRRQHTADIEDDGPPTHSTIDVTV